MLNNGYKIVSKPDHPRAWSTGYVYEHVLVMEEKLGRFLNHDEIVHHKDENRLNNSPNNLELMTFKTHGKHHAKRSDSLVLKCDSCGTAFTRRKNQSAKSKGYARSFCSRKCYWEALSAAPQVRLC